MKHFFVNLYSLFQNSRSGLALICEVCGVQVKNSIQVEIDGAILNVCVNCAKLGRRLKHKEPQEPRTVRIQKLIQQVEKFDIDPDYSIKVRTAREKLGLSHEQLGKLISVKPSVISHIETGKLKPDIALARKLMHSLKINLLVPVSELEKRQTI